MYDTVLLALGEGETTQFLAFGMLVNVLVSMGFQPDHRVRTGFYELSSAE